MQLVYLTDGRTHSKLHSNERAKNYIFGSLYLGSFIVFGNSPLFLHHGPWLRQTRPHTHGPHPYTIFLVSLNSDKHMPSRMTAITTKSLLEMSDGSVAFSFSLYDPKPSSSQDTRWFRIHGSLRGSYPPTLHPYQHVLWCAPLP